MSCSQFFGLDSIQEPCRADPFYHHLTVSGTNILVTDYINFAKLCSPYKIGKIYLRSEFGKKKGGPPFNHTLKPEVFG